MNRNVFTYWDGEKSDLIKKLEFFLVKICEKNGYHLHHLNKDTVGDYIDIPENFKKIKHILDITDFIRVKLLRKYGGMWIDCDVLARRSFDDLFEVIDKNKCFLVSVPWRMKFNNAILGCEKDSEFYSLWESENNITLEKENSEWGQLPFGNFFLKKNEELIKSLDVAIIHGQDSQIEPFVNFRSEVLLSTTPIDSVISKNPPLIHFFNRNCRKYNQMNEEERKNTLLYGLIQNAHELS